MSRWMDTYGHFLLRLAMGIVFIWFGALKPLGLSPAADLIAQTTWWLPIPHFLYVLGIWEIAIGGCFLYKPLLRIALILLFLHIPGTMLPLVLLPGLTFLQAPFVLTLEGQYIIKNLVLIAAAIVIGGKMHPATAEQTQPTARFDRVQQCIAAPHGGRDRDQVHHAIVTQPGCESITADGTANVLTNR